MKPVDESEMKFNERFFSVCLEPDCFDKRLKDSLFCDFHWIKHFSCVPDMEGKVIVCKNCGRRIYNNESLKENCPTKAEFFALRFGSAEKAKQTLYDQKYKKHIR